MRCLFHVVGSFHILLNADLWRRGKITFMKKSANSEAIGAPIFDLQFSTLRRRVSVCVSRTRLSESDGQGVGVVERGVLLREGKEGAVKWLSEMRVSSSGERDIRTRCEVRR